MPALRYDVVPEPLTTSILGTLSRLVSVSQALAGTLHVNVLLLPRYEPTVRERVPGWVGEMRPWTRKRLPMTIRSCRQALSLSLPPCRPAVLSFLRRSRT